MDVQSRIMSLLCIIFGYTVLGMNIQTKKIELIQWLSSLTDVDVINEIMKLRENGARDWWFELSNEDRSSIEQGLEDADSGKLKPHSEARKLYEK
ncbi:MAG: hypothetical protein ACI9JN_001419 [Bacteroidia bacterium]|jgi:hypothetical protein